VALYGGVHADADAQVSATGRPVPADLSPDDAAECDRLLTALPEAIRRASNLLQERSVYDPVYLEADAEVSKILSRISELWGRAPTDAHERTNLMRANE
jgi:hypothetical protein